MEELGKLTHFFVSVDEQRMVAIFENGGCSEIIKNGMTTKQVSQALRTLADRIDQWKDHDEHHA